MAQTSSTDKSDDTATLLKGRLDSALDTQQPFLADWDTRERLFMARQATTRSQNDSRIYEGSLTTIVIERAVRTTAQMPTGTVYKKDLDDDDNGFLMGLMLDNHILPNANSQRDALTKIRMTSIYKHIYGVQGARIGYLVRDGKLYVDFWLPDARDMLYQPNRYSTKDMDWGLVASVVSVGTLRTWRKDTTGSWVKEALDKLIEMKSKGAVASKLNDGRRTTVNQSNAQRPSEKGDGATVDIYQCYERGTGGKIYTFAIENIKVGKKSSSNVLILRTTDNFMPDGSLAIATNVSVPLLDRMYGLGDFERNKSIQMGLDSAASLGMSALALQTLPPIALPTQGVVESTIQLAPQARWRTDAPQKIIPLNLAPQAIPSYQTMNSTLKSFLNNNQGTTNSQIPGSQAGNPSQGLTPEAIRKQGETQNARDAWDVEMNEDFMTELFTKLINVQANAIVKPVTFYVYGSDVGRLKESSVPTKLYKVSKNGKVAKVTVSKKDIEGEYFWQIDKGSAFAKNSSGEADALQQAFETVTSNPLVIQMLNAEGTQVKLGDMLQRQLNTAGVKDADKLIQTHDEQTDSQELTPEQQASQQAQMQQQQPPPAPAPPPDAFAQLAAHPDPQVQQLAQLHAQQLMQAMQQGQPQQVMQPGMMQ